MGWASGTPGKLLHPTLACPVPQRPGSASDATVGGSRWEAQTELLAPGFSLAHPVVRGYLVSDPGMAHLPACIYLSS